MSLENYRKIDIFKGLTNQYITNIAHYLHYKVIEKNNIIFLEGDKIKFLPILLSGKVEISKFSSEGKKLTIWYIRPYQAFCLAALTIGEAISTAKTIQPSQIAYFNLKDLKFLFKKYPIIQENIFEILSKRFVYKSKLLHSIVLNNPEQRILEILNNPDNLCKAEDGFIVNLNQNEIASLSGLCRETVCRIIAKLKKEGLIKTKNKKILLTDLNRIKSFLV
ncbi:Crp/Fnr family transcriptional regulator [Hippea jasoniae]|uniref:Crp/Fnr family transcriptional regulator n=1 Tax=Hippea jasoniae TaxID=944479 RepID=UPI000558893E|nr:Crp/Fnr family transcriptional regulator [Hippea jasoniae]